MTNYVPPIGPVGARIALIGEAPGEEEARSGIPFVGASGKMLNLMLGNCGIDRNSCYITNVVKERPPGNDFSTLYMDKRQREPSPQLLRSIEDLHAELRRVRPNIIVPLGAEALRAVTGKIKSENGVCHGPIMQWRGSLLQTQFGKCCPTLHPAYVLRQYRSRITVEFDLKRICQESLTPTLTLPQHEMELGPTFARILDFLRDIKENKRPFAFDIETSGPFVRCLGLSERSNHALCIPFMGSPQSTAGPTNIIPTVLGPIERNSFWSVDQERTILHTLNDIFLDPEIQKIAQNFPFDALVLARDFGLDCSPGFTLDTMVAQHTCFSELPKGLDYLASIYTRVPYYSDFDASSDRQTWLYNCYDNAVTFEIADRLREEMAGLGVLDFYENRVHPSIISYTRAETRGILVDQMARADLRKKTETDLEELSKKILAATGSHVTNPNSDKQIKEYIYGPLGLKPILHFRTRQPSVDKHAREKLRLKYPEHAAFFNNLDSYSTQSTLLDGFLRKELGFDGRCRTHYNVAGTVTGRLASSEPLFDIGTNLTNQPRGSFRRIYISDPGWSLLKADLSQAEFRIVVWRANVRWIIERYLTDPSYDIHRQLASMIFSKPPLDISKDERSTAKNGVYGGMYGMGYETAARTYKLPLNTARFVLDRFHALVPEIKNVYWSWIRNCLLHNRTIINPCGRQRIFFDRMGDDLERESRSHFAQSTVGDIINQAFCRIDREWDEEEAYPLLQVHDEIVCQVREGKEDFYARKLKAAMEIPLLGMAPEPLIIPVEIGHGKNWYDVKTMELK